MDILVLTHRIPYPPSRGDKVRSYNILKRLGSRHRLHLFCFLDEKGDEKRVEEVKKFCASVNVVRRSSVEGILRFIFGIFSKKPWSASYFYSRGLDRLVKQALNDRAIDAMYVYSYQMAQYAMGARQYKVMDLTDVESDKWRQFAGRVFFPFNIACKMEGQKLKRYEEQIIRRFDKTLVISQNEKDLIEDAGLKEKIEISPNGVDLDYFNRQKPYEGKHDIVFTGLMSHIKNIDAACFFYDEIFPIVKEKVPQAKFLIVGKDPSEKLRKIAAKDASVVVTGYIKDVRPFYEEAGVFVAPMRVASGMQNKVLEAVAMGAPVVATAMAMQGIDLKEGAGLYITDDKKEFAQKTIMALKDPGIRESSKSLIDGLKSKYDWDKVVDRIDRLLGAERR